MRIHSKMFKKLCHKYESALEAVQLNAQSTPKIINTSTVTIVPITVYMVPIIWIP